MLEKIKRFFRKILLIHDSPKKIAGGAALGVFLAIMPGEGVLATIILSSFFRLNRLSAVASVLAFNMWSTAVILPAAALTGCWIFGIRYDNLISDFNEAWSLGLGTFFTDTVILHIALPLVVGFIIVSALAAGFFYFLVLLLLKKEKVSLTAESGKIFDPKESIRKIKKRIPTPKNIKFKKETIKKF